LFTGIALVNGDGRNWLKFGLRLRLLHVAVSAQMTVCAIRPERGYEPVQRFWAANMTDF